MTGKVIRMYRSFKVGIKTKSDKDWVYNSLRFPTKQDAFNYAENLVGRWSEVLAYIIVPTDDEPNQPPSTTN